MKIDKKTVSYLADLAKIDLNEKEIEKFSKQLSDIISFIEKLKQIEVTVKIKEEYINLNDVSRIDDHISWPENENKLALNQENIESGLIKAPGIR